MRRVTVNDQELYQGHHLAHSGNGARGFTLLELLITMAVLAVLVGLAAPSFTNISLNSSLRTYTNDIAISVQLARSEAIKRNGLVKICVSVDAINCIAGPWRQGWIVFNDLNNNNAVDAADGNGDGMPDDTVFLVQAPAAAGFNITETAALSVINFQPSGLGAAPASFIICRATPLGEQERVVTVSVTGRTSATKTANSVCP